MTAALVWSAPADQAILALRAAGASWDRIAAAVGVSRWSAIRRGAALGATAPARPPPPATDEGREPLAAGDPASWDALTRATRLAGRRYPWPPLALVAAASARPEPACTAPEAGR